MSSSRGQLRSSTAAAGTFTTTATTTAAMAAPSYASRRPESATPRVDSGLRSSCGGGLYASGGALSSSMSASGLGGGGGGGGGTVLGGVDRTLSVKQMREMVEELYASKAKHDAKTMEAKLPRETMEQHLYTHLNTKYGLKSLILECANQRGAAAPCTACTRAWDCMHAASIASIASRRRPFLWQVCERVPRRRPPLLARGQRRRRLRLHSAQRGGRGVPLRAEAAQAGACTPPSREPRRVLVPLPSPSRHPPLPLLSLTPPATCVYPLPELTQTVAELLRVYLKGKQPLKTDAAISELLQVIIPPPPTPPASSLLLPPLLSPHRPPPAPLTLRVPCDAAISNRRYCCACCRSGWAAS